MVAEPTVAAGIRKIFREAGFEAVEVAKAPETIEVKKYNCSCLLQRSSRGKWVPLSPPNFKVRGLNCELEDRGYQRFWYHEGKQFPVRANDLRTLHRFEEEVRAILGLKSLYHESLGTTSARSAYDRLDGRPDK